jgi:hypothetical protein
MANESMVLSKKGTERLDIVMTRLSLINGRPDTLRIAFAKGLTEAKEDPVEREKGGGWTIPAGVVARGHTYTLYKHLMIDKLGFPLETQKEIDQYLIRYIELGLEIMENEIEHLSDLDNYILYLVEHAKKEG